MIHDVLDDHDFIFKTFAERFKPSTTLDLDVWAEEHVRMPYSAVSERFSCALTPYLREPLKICAGNTVINGHRIEEVTIMAAVQGAKSALEEAIACYAIAEDAGPMMWNFQGDSDAKEAAESRLLKLFRATKPVCALLPHKYRTQVISFDHMFLIIQGAESKGNLQSKSIRWQLNDETWLWPAGHLAEARKRTTAWWNRMIINVSTGSVWDDDTDTAWKEGDQRVWSHTCPACGHSAPFQLLTRGRECGLTWDENELTRKKDGTWNYIEVAKTVKYQCRCGKLWKDTPASRETMNATGFYAITNLNATPKKVSFRFPAMCVPWISWVDVVVEFLKACDAMKLGVLIPLQEFVQKRLGEAFRPRGVEAPPDSKTSTYKMGDPWPEAFRKFMGVDVQSDHFWVVIRGVSEYGKKSRKLWCGRVDGTYDDVRAKQLEFGVDDICVIVDAAYGQGGKGPRSVFYQCCRFGWTATFGDDREFFSEVDKKTGLPKKVLVSKPQLGDPLLGAKASDGMDKSAMKLRVCRVFRWSNPGVKDILENLWRGRGIPWEIAEDTPIEWFNHMKAEIKKVVPNKQTGRPDIRYVLVDRKGAHLRDCECLIIVGMIRSGLLAADFVKPSELEMEIADSVASVDTSD
jgi:hypothetical protein